MKTVFILNESYPAGMAASRRLHLFAKGLVEQGDDVSIVIPRAKDKSSSENVQLQGTFQGVKFYHTGGSILRSKNFVKRKWNDIVGPVRGYLLIKKKLKPEKIIISSSKEYHIILYKLLSIFIGVEYIRSKSEVPYFKKDKINWLQSLKTKLLFSGHHGIVVISEELAIFFKDILKINTRLLVLPIIQESNNEPEADIFKNYHTILYTGSLSERKDGIISIIKAIAEVRNNFNDVKLVITGNAKSSVDYQKATGVIDELDLNDNVSFTGYITSHELVKLTLNSGLLISIKPNNRQNSYNFPTKLGEYLSSGVPVLSTKTESISNYLTDGENIFFTSQDYISISKEIIYIFENHEIAVKVGQAGKTIADKYFDYKYQTKRLRKFLINGTR